MRKCRTSKLVFRWLRITYSIPNVCRALWYWKGHRTGRRNNVLALHDCQRPWPLLTMYSVILSVADISAQMLKSHLVPMKCPSRRGKICLVICLPWVVKNIMVLVDAYNYYFEIDLLPNIKSVSYHKEVESAFKLFWHTQEVGNWQCCIFYEWWMPEGNSQWICHLSTSANVLLS